MNIENCIDLYARHATALVALLGGLASPARGAPLLPCFPMMRDNEAGMRDAAAVAVQTGVTIIGIAYDRIGGDLPVSLCLFVPGPTHGLATAVPGFVPVDHGPDARLTLWSDGGPHHFTGGGPMMELDAITAPRPTRAAIERGWSRWMAEAANAKPRALPLVLFDMLPGNRRAQDRATRKAWERFCAAA